MSEHESRKSVFERHPKLTAAITALMGLIVIDLAAGLIVAPILKRRQQESQKRHEALLKQVHVRSDAYHHGLAPNRYLPQHRWGSYTYTLFTNSLGFRDRSIRRVEPAAGKCRIVFIGDSFTYGSGVDFDDTFVGRIQEAYENRGIEVLNAAAGSYCPLLYYRKVQYLLDEVGLQFNELVVFIDISDAQDEAEGYAVREDGRVVAKELKVVQGDTRKAHDVREGFGASVFRFLRDNTIMFHAACMYWRSLYVPPAIGLRRSSWTIDKNLLDEYGRRGMELMKANMDRLLALTKVHNIRLSIAVYPWPDQIYYNDVNSVAEKLWRKWAHDNHVFLMDFFPLFINRKMSAEDVLRTYYLTADFHWNPKGHKLIADTFLKIYKPECRGSSHTAQRSHAAVYP